MQHFTASEYLKMDIAARFGLDKADWADREIWFQFNRENLDNLVKQAEEPAMFYAAVQAWKHFQNGTPSGYGISLDATASGAQILSCLTRDEKSAKLCNVLNSGSCSDLYTVAYGTMRDRYGLGNAIARKDVKDGIMTSLYGSEAEPKRVFGPALLPKFEETMETEMPFVWELNKFCLQIWDASRTSYSWTMPDGFYAWFKVERAFTENGHFYGAPVSYTHVEQAPKKSGRSICANMTHSVDGMMVRELGRRCMYDVGQVARVQELLESGIYTKAVTDEEAGEELQRLWDLWERTQFFSFRMLDYINAGTACIVDPELVLAQIRFLPSKPFKFLAVHDCFRVHPNYGNDIRKQYNFLLASLWKSNLLPYLLEEITGNPDMRNIELPNPERWRDILDADYPLC